MIKRRNILGTFSKLLLSAIIKEQKFRVVALRGIEPLLPKTTPIDPLLQTRYPPLKERRFYLGFTSWPSGPTPQAVEETYQFISQNADVLTEHIEGVPWTEALEGKPFAEAFQKNIEQRRRHRPLGLKLVLAISPLNMGRNGLASYFGEQENMPLPKVFQQNDFVKALLSQAQDDRYLFVTQFASRDFDELWKTFPEEVKDLGRLWRDTGLVDENDTKRPAFHTWADVLARRRF